MRWPISLLSIISSNIRVNHYCVINLWFQLPNAEPVENPDIFIPPRFQSVNLIHNFVLFLKNVHQLPLKPLIISLILIENQKNNAYRNSFASTENYQMIDNSRVYLWCSNLIKRKIQDERSPRTLTSFFQKRESAAGGKKELVISCRLRLFS